MHDGRAVEQTGSRAKSNGSREWMGNEEGKRENDEAVVKQDARRHGCSALGQSESQTSVASTIFVAGGGESQRRILDSSEEGRCPC